MLSPRPLAPTLVPSLNALLDALALPFAVEHPADLTPSLLLAIFESIIAARLPIPLAIRQSRTSDAKARAMLVLLGVLECDILRGGASSNPDDSALTGAGGVSVDGWADDIGLGQVDPQRLADGGWEETIFVGELLCWLARRKGILPRAKSSHRRPRSLYSNHHAYDDEDGSVDLSTSLLLRPSPAQNHSPPSDMDPDCSALSHITDVPRHPHVRSPEPSFSASATTGTDLSIRARSVSSRTSISNTHDGPDELDEASHDTLQMHDPRQMMQDAQDDDDQPPTFRPRCIHDLEDPSYVRALGAPSDRSLVSQDDREQGDPQTPTPRRVRLSGWIEPVDADSELTAFIASRGRATHLSAHARESGPSCRRRIPPTSSPSPPNALLTTRPRVPSPPPSPPSDSDTDAPFDMSFSNLNKTSTPAKPKLRTRPLGLSRAQTSTWAAPLYTPSLPMPGKADSRSGSTVSATTAMGKRREEPMKTITSPPLGSTARTSTLLTERARLLTELAALKRARALSNGASGAGAGAGGTGSRSGVIHHRVGVGV